ncbi:tetratricopeptide (TPR) repeat protein [Bradyrhizobium sp. i1.15.2]
MRMPTTGMAGPTRQDRLRTAQEFIAAGRLEEAETLLEQVVATSDPDTLSAKAALALARQRTELAFELLAEAATGHPDHAGLATNLGIAHEMLGRFDEAVICLKRAAALAPRSQEIKLTLAHALESRGDVAEARAITKAVVEHEPGNARALLQLGTLDIGLRDYSSAEIALLRALELVPNDPDTLRNLSVLLFECGCFEQALNVAEHAHLRAPLDTAGLSHLAYCRAAMGLWAEAEATCRRLLAYAPTHLGAREILTRVMIANGEEERAIAELTTFVRAHKSHPSAALLLADVLRFVGRFDEALRLASYVSRTQTQDEAAKSLATALELTLGRFPRPEPAALGVVMRVIVPPRTGALEFIALARLLRRATSRQNVHVVAEPRYQALLRNLAEQAILDEPRPGLSTTPLQSLLPILSTDARNIAVDVPYLRPDAELSARWRDALAAFPRPWVGLVWEGGALGLSMEQIAAVIPHSVTPVSLMTDARRHDLKRWSRPIDVGVHIEHPAEFIAAIANLDAVVGPDSFAVHIAGALGLPGVVFVPRGYPWYWAQADGKPLWYPSFEVVVQERLGHWSGPIDDGRHRLETLLRIQTID